MAEVEVAVEAGAATQAQGVTRILQGMQATKGGQVTHRAIQDLLHPLRTGQRTEFTPTALTKIRELGTMLTFRTARRMSLCIPTTRHLIIIILEDITQRCF